MTATETDVEEVVDDRPDETDPAVVEAAAYDRLARNVYFAGNALHIDDRDLIETRLVRQRWSPSSALSLNDGCPTKWAIEKLLPRSADPLGAAELGTAGHWVLETMFGMPALERTLEAAIAIIESITPEKNTDLAVPTEPGPRFMWGAEVLGKISGLWQTEDPMKVVAIGRETQLDNVSIGGVPFNGIVDRTSLVTIDGRRGLSVEDYKGLALDTPIPTPTGWTTMGDLAVGDLALGTSGLPVSVTVKSGVHHRPCYRITFSDKSSITCDNVHLWTVNAGTASSNVKYDAISADKLFELFTLGKTSRYHMRPYIDAASALDLPDANLPIDPYLLGAWLGDGDSRGGFLSVGFSETEAMVNLLSQRWPGRTSVNKERTCNSVGLCHTDSQEAFTGLLRHEGLIGNKHIPMTYLRASISQRIDLLRGLMDTDGHWHTERRRVVFVTAKENLWHEVGELVVSLGITPQMTEVTPKVTGPMNKHHYRVEFSPLGFNPFLLPRKADAVSVGTKLRSAKRTIIGMEPVESVPTQCIQVDAADSLYLAGPLMVPTHNTGKVPRDKAKGMHHADQARLYHLAYTQLHNEEPIARKIIYTGFGVVADIDAPATELDRVQSMFVDTFEKATVRAETGVFDTVFSGLCGWCPLTTVCPTAKAGGRNSARVPGAKAGTEIGIRVLPAIMATTVVRDDPDLVIPVADEPPIDPQYDPEPPPDVHVDPLPPVDAQYDPEPPPDPFADEAPIVVEVDDFGTPILRPGPTSLMAEAETRKETEMTSSTWSGGEGKTWELTNPDGSPNPNSFAASGVFGMVDVATKAIEAAGYKAGAYSVLALSQTFMSIIDQAMRKVTVTGTAGLNDGLHTRLRGALYSFIEKKPLPIGQPVEVWDVWAAEATTRISGVANVSFFLMSNDIPERPWASEFGAALLLPAAPVATNTAAAA